MPKLLTIIKWVHIGCKTVCKLLRFAFLKVPPDFVATIVLVDTSINCHKTHDQNWAMPRLLWSLLMHYYDPSV